MVKEIFQKLISESIICIKVQQSCLYLDQISGSFEFVRKKSSVEITFW